MFLFLLVDFKFENEFWRMEIERPQGHEIMKLRGGISYLQNGLSMIKIL